MDLDVFGLNAEMSAEENRLIKKRDLRNLLTSYADEADVFTEIVQNAVDAIRIAKDTRLYDTKEPKITIYIGRRESESHYFAVQDNGIGMSREVVRWTRLMRQFGGLAKVDRVGFYAANCSVICAVA